MKTTFKLTFLCAAIIVATLAGCKKYPEGPGLTVLSKKTRLAGDWKLDKELVNGVEQSLSGTTTTLKIEKSGSYTYTSTGTGYSITDAGKWEFIDKKDDLKTTSNVAGATADTAVILKLKSKELWVIDKTGTFKTESHYKQ